MHWREKTVRLIASTHCQTGTFSGRGFPKGEGEVPAQLGRVQNTGADNILVLYEAVYWFKMMIKQSR